MRNLFALLLTTTSLAASADVFPDAPHIYVEGSAEIRVEPDTLDIDLEIEATDLQLAAAKASVDERARRLIAACRKLGVEDGDIKSTSLQISPAYDYPERKLLGTRVRRQVGVTLRNLERYPELVEAIVASKVSGISLTTMSSSKSKQALDDAQKAALADARARAERLAQGSGQELGSAYSVSEFNHRAEERYLLSPARGFDNDREVQANLVSDSGGEPFQPGAIVATATVYVIYLLGE